LNSFVVARVPQLRKDTYTRLTPVQRLQVARHPNRPTFLDIALNISDKFVELHGDRAGLDDPAMVCGLASIDGVSFMFIGHQKGRNTKVHVHPGPHGHGAHPPGFHFLFVCQAGFADLSGDISTVCTRLLLGQLDVLDVPLSVSG
jgi:acetyl-CoA carboxylase alpha subunit